MLLETSATLNAGTFAVGPTVGESVGPTAMRIPGATLLVSQQTTVAAAEAGLKSLREFRTAGRRAVWCNLSELARVPGIDLRAFGQRMVDEGGAELVVVCGNGGRDAAVGARDAGLALGRVVVCRDEATARNVLGDSLALDDAVLVIGVGGDGAQRLADRLESRFSRKLAAAAN
jgi:hypothetical protein